MSAEARLHDLGIQLQKGSSRIGDYNYIPVRRVGDLAFVSGQLPRREVAGAQRIVVGTLGSTCSIPDGVEAARLCGVSILSVLADSIGGLDNVRAVVKVEGFVNSLDTFRDHPEIIDGCSRLFVDVFGREKGSHSRTAVGCSSLPKGAAVEVSAIFQLNA